MIASNVRISDEAWTLNRMTNAKRRKLRERIIVDLIKSKPNQAPIKVDEFVRAGRFNSPSTAYYTIDKLIKRGVITRIATSPTQGGTYIVNDHKATSPATPTPPAPELTLHPSLEQLAKDFVWFGSYSGEVAGALKKFVDYVEHRQRGEV